MAARSLKKKRRKKAGKVSRTEKKQLKEQLKLVVYEGWSPSNSRCVDGTGRTLLTQTWSNTEVFYWSQNDASNLERSLKPKSLCHLSITGGASLLIYWVKPFPMGLSLGWLKR